MPFSHGKDGGGCVFVCFLRRRMFSHHPVGEGLAPPVISLEGLSLYAVGAGHRPARRFSATEYFPRHPVGKGLAPPVVPFRGDLPEMLSGRVSDPPAVFRKGFVPCEGFRPAGRPPLPAAAKEANRRRGRLTSPSGQGPSGSSSFPPAPRLRGIPLRPSVEVPAHKIRFPV